MSSNSHEVVTFKIGKAPGMKTMIVHKEVSCFYSPVLKAASDSEFIEGQTQTYVLEDVEVETFRLAVQWFYGQQIESYLTQEEVDAVRCNVTHTKENKEIVDTKIEKRQNDLVRLWVLGDRLGIPDLQNLAVDELDQIRKDWDLIPYRCFNYVYEHTSTRRFKHGLEWPNTLQRLLLSQCAVFLPADTIKKEPQYFPKEMLIQYVDWERDIAVFNSRVAFVMDFHAFPEDDERYFEKMAEAEEADGLDAIHSKNHITGITRWSESGRVKSYWGNGAEEWPLI